MDQSRTIKFTVIFTAVFILSFAVLIYGPWPQDQSYHHFSDSRFLLFQNGLNVLSNLIFLLAGLYGLIFLPRYSRDRQIAGVFYLSLVFVCFGSAYYHFQPHDASLVWDRLPMTFSFLALVAQIFVILFSIPKVNYIFYLFLLLGPLSLLYWQLMNDLSFYLIIQFGGMVFLLLSLLLFKFDGYQKRYLWLCFLFYGLAKITEILDTQIYHLTSEVISGHSLKHLLAGMGAAVLVHFYSLFNFRG